MCESGDLRESTDCSLRCERHVAWATYRVADLCDAIFEEYICPMRFKTACEIPGANEWQSRLAKLGVCCAIPVTDLQNAVLNQIRDLDTNRLEIDKPQLEQRQRDLFHRLAHPPVQLDLIVQRAEYVRDGALFRKRRLQERASGQDRSIQIRHRRAVCITHNPRPDTGVSKVIGRVAWIGPSIAESHPKAAGSAQPPVLVVTNQRPSLHISTPAVDDVARADKISVQALSVLYGDTGDPILDYPVVANILRHDRRDADRHVVGSV